MAVIRDIRPNDRERWEALFLEYGVFYETSFDRTVVDGVWAWLMDDAAEVRAFVAVDGDEVIGFTHYRPQPDTFTAASGWFLDDLFVDPAARGSGAATALIEAVAEYATAHGGGTLRWITTDDNERAQRVYDRIATKATWVTYEREC